MHFIKFALTGCFGTNDKTSRTNFGSSTPSSVTTLLWGPFRTGLSCLSESIANLSLSILLINSEWSLFSLLMLYTIEGISSFFTSFLRMPLSSKFFLEQSTALFRTTSFIKSLSWKLCTPWSEKISFLGIRNLKKSAMRSLLLQFFKKSNRYLQFNSLFEDFT